MAVESGTEPLRPPDRLRQADVARRWGVSRARINQLVRDGHLVPDVDGRITEAELIRCRLHAPVRWQHPCRKSGPIPAAELARRQAIRQWVQVEDAMNPHWALNSDQWRRLAPPLLEAMRNAGLPLL